MALKVTPAKPLTKVGAFNTHFRLICDHVYLYNIIVLCYTDLGSEFFDDFFFSDEAVDALLEDNGVSSPPTLDGLEELPRR